MLHNRPVNQLAGAIMGIALCASSTAAGAAATPTASISPLVALSAFGTPASASAVCAAAIQGAAAVAAAQAPAPGTGCVLPVVDAPVPVAQPAPPPAPIYAAVEQPSFGLLPVLLGLAAIAGIAALLLSDDDDGHLDLTPGSPD